MTPTPPRSFAPPFTTSPHRATQGVATAGATSPSLPISPAESPDRTSSAFRPRLSRGRQLRLSRELAASAFSPEQRSQRATEGSGSPFAVRSPPTSPTRDLMPAEEHRALVGERPLPAVGTLPMAAASRANIGQAAMKLHAIDLEGVGERNAARRNLKLRERRQEAAEAAAVRRAKLNAAAQQLQTALRSKITRRSHLQHDQAVQRMRLNRVARVIQSGWRRYLKNRYGPSFAEIVLLHYRQRKALEGFMHEILDRCVSVAVKRANRSFKGRKKPTGFSGELSGLPPGGMPMSPPAGRRRSSGELSGLPLGGIPANSPGGTFHGHGASEAAAGATEPTRSDRAASAKEVLLQATALADEIARANDPHRTPTKAKVSRTTASGGKSARSRASSGSVLGGAGTATPRAGTPAPASGGKSARSRASSGSVPADAGASTPRGGTPAPAKLKKSKTRKELKL